MFQSVRDADHDAAARLLRTSSDPETVMLNLLRMLSIYLRGETPDKLDYFIASSHRAGLSQTLAPAPRHPLSQEGARTRGHERIREVHAVQDHHGSAAP